MADLSATRKIISVSTPNGGTYYVGSGHGYYEKITTAEKNGGMTYMIIWYQLWRNGHVVKEINSLQVVDVDYETIDDPDPLQF